MADVNVKLEAELQQFINDMAEAVPMMDVTDRTREIVKAGLRFSMQHAITQHMRRGGPLKLTDLDTTALNTEVANAG